jgi:protein phosphatase
MIADEQFCVSNHSRHFLSYEHEILNRVLLPENALLTLCGIAGCGKSTFAAHQFLPTQIVSSDECRALICDDEANQLVTSHAFELWRFIIRKRLLLGRFTVADATNLEWGDRHWLTRTAHNFHFYSAIILFNLPFAVCLQRNAARQRIVPQEALQRQYGYFQQTLQTIHDEGFDKVLILNETEQVDTHIELVPPGQQLTTSCEV